MIRYKTEIIENGDYVPDDNGRLALEDYTLAILQDLARAAEVNRGSFYPDKNYGGFLAQATPRALYIAALARQALYPLSGVYVESAELDNGSILLNLIINKTKRQVEISL